MRCLGERGDRVFGRGVEVVGNDNAGDLAAGGTYVGHIDHCGVDLVQLHLRQRRFYVWLQRDWLDGDLGVGEHLGRDGAARDLGLAQRDLDAALREIGNARYVGWIARRHRDLHHVLDEVRRRRRPARTDDLLHVLRRCRGKHVRRGALVDPLGKVRAGPAPQLDVAAGMVALELTGQRGERLLERGGSEHRDGTAACWAGVRATGPGGCWRRDGRVLARRAPCGYGYGDGRSRDRGENDDARLHVRV